MSRQILGVLAHPFSLNSGNGKDKDVEKAINEQSYEGTRDATTPSGSSWTEASPDQEQDDSDYEQDIDDDKPQYSSRRRLMHAETLSSFFADTSLRAKLPQWWQKFKTFLYPPDSDSDRKTFVPNYRYTPILSGVLIPFSILLEIPGLTQHWYIRTEDDKIVENRPNTFILDFGLGFSIAFALLANIALIARFLERKVKLMTIACVVFLTIHDLINIVAVIVFGVEHRFDDGFTYGQSFWMTVCSTIVSSITNGSLVVDLIRTPDFASSGSGLTRRQRSLIIIVIILLLYIALGALVQAVMLQLRFIDALYFTVCLIETVGFGDIVPDSTGSKVFTCFYTVFGILNLALAVSLTRETVLEALEVGYLKRVNDVRQRRKRQRWMRRVAARWREAVEWRLRDAGQPIWRHDELDGWVHFEWLINFGKTVLPWTQSKRLGAVAHPRGMHLNLEGLTGTQLKAAAMEAGVPLDDLLPPGFSRRWRAKQRMSDTRPEEREREPGSGPYFGLPGSVRDPQKEGDPEDIPLTHARLGRMVAMLGNFAFAVDKSGWLNGDIPWKQKKQPKGSNQGRGDGQGQTATPRYRVSLSQKQDAHRQGMESEEKKAFYARLAVVWMLFLVFWMLGSGVFTATEHWSFGNALYFCVVSFTTLGLGDFAPKTPAGRSFFVVWALLGVATMTILISVISEAYSSRYKTALQSTKTFDRAVSKYKAKQKALTSTPKKKRSVASVGAGLSPPGPRESFVGDSKHAFSPPVSDEEREIIVQEVQSRLKQRLEELPRQILYHARTFHESMEYFVGPGNVGVSGISGAPTESAKEKMPESLRSLLDDISGATKFGERIQHEILQDADARYTLFTLSIEKALRKMIEAAEDAVESLEERDLVLALREDDRARKERELAAVDTDSTRDLGDDDGRELDEHRASGSTGISVRGLLR